ncbi:DotU family type IV/VI secretion system protein [Burkholderia cenocepacia]|uniref:DotU family type IV/VI secretion system protein n=1 Tax=Burkholderia cenocepacia TaxID=95486 RepID=UPI000F585F84|nr:DotU/TssL family secretion system protein [Burkholderia cenocepacia]MBR8307123.1 DotU family type IV/VI secretion system protein [Burkholderia cenocepacia]MEC4770160.1 DotU/TssL family secretion system protein [Burkholderia cenocepacia]RQU74639.1 DotU family type IV/VI secretion system protein [Burkholderia cenocepacia]RQV00016.1 DotU family type IV/VI secretion system protein [Burkholderia cenocepacia]
MNTLTPNRSDTALMPNATGTSIPCSDGMRDLLRDTALLVTTLTSGGQTQDAVALRARCKQLVEQFASALRHRGFPDDVRNEALVAQCGLLDEAALRHLPGESRSAWEREPLQVEQFNLHEAGERVFERLETRMREPAPPVALLECYSAILGMGFVGRYARDGEAKRIALIASLNARLETLRPSPDRPFIADRVGRRMSDWFYRLSPWAIAGLACVAAAIVWGVWSVTLDGQLAHLVAAKAARP